MVRKLKTFRRRLSLRLTTTLPSHVVYIAIRFTRSPFAKFGQVDEKALLLS